MKVGEKISLILAPQKTHVSEKQKLAIKKVVQIGLAGTHFKDSELLDYFNCEISYIHAHWLLCDSAKWMQKCTIFLSNHPKRTQKFI